MAEEMEFRNGALPREGGESTVMINVGSAETHNAGKSFLLRTHKLRNLAIASIICGCSCLGVLALIYAVKVSCACVYDNFISAPNERGNSGQLLGQKF